MACGIGEGGHAIRNGPDPKPGPLEPPRAPCRRVVCRDAAPLASHPEQPPWATFNKIRRPEFWESRRRPALEGRESVQESQRGVGAVDRGAAEQSPPVPRSTPGSCAGRGRVPAGRQTTHAAAELIAAFQDAQHQACNADMMADNGRWYGVGVALPSPWLPTLDGAALPPLPTRYAAHRRPVDRSRGQGWLYFSASFVFDCPRRGPGGWGGAADGSRLLDRLGLPQPHRRRDALW